ncbi:MAG: dihydrofolate reductase family protein [Renibacterium sp.]|nr:dihydrofolate reductase family protein [Renibacterium sp.]
MRKLVVQQWVTVDNIAAEPDGGLSFVSGAPFDDSVTDNPFQNRVMELIDSVDTMILGANTYAQAKDYWPYATEQGKYGQKLNGLNKFVASRTLDDAPWGEFAPATVLRDPGGIIRKLKAQPGKDLWIWGSLQLMRSMFESGLIDEVRLLLCPVSRGAGLRVFDGSQDLTLLEAAGFDNGVTLLRYGVPSLRSASSSALPG